MANLNPIQMNQPVKGLNSNQSINADSQESFIDQSFTSFPDELEAAKGQSQNPSTSADSSEPKSENLETVDLQNLPAAAAIGMVNPANIAAAIQVMAPVDAAAIEVINLEQLQLASLNQQVTTLPEQLISEVIPQLDTSADVQAIAQTLVTPQSLAVASQNIQETITGDQPVAVVQQRVSVAASQVVEQNVAIDADLVNVSTTDAQSPVLTSSLEVNNQVLSSSDTKDPVSNVDQSLDLVANPVAVDASTIAQVASQNSEQVVSVSSDAVAATSLDVSKSSRVINPAQLPTSEQATAVNALAVDQSLTNVSQVVIDDASGAVQNAQAQAQAPVASVTNTDNKVQISSDITQVAISADVAPEVKAAAALTGQVEVPAEVSAETVMPAISSDVEQVAKVLVAESKQATTTNQNISDKVQVSTANAVTAPQVANADQPQASVIANAQSVEVSRDDLAQSEDILAARAENAKLAKSDASAIQVDQLSSVDLKDLNKVDAVNNGAVFTDSNRSTFAANANQELKLAQAAPVKLEPHHVSLANGPLNIEVMRVLKEGGGRVIMEVTPPDQGTLQIDLRLDNQGKAILIVDGASDSTRARLEQGSAELRQQLADMGLQLSLNMRQKSDSEAQFRFASSSDGFVSGNAKNDASVNLDQVGGIISNQINTDGRVHLYA